MEYLLWLVIARDQAGEPPVIQSLSVDIERSFYTFFLQNAHGTVFHDYGTPGNYLEIEYRAHGTRYTREISVIMCVCAWNTRDCAWNSRDCVREAGMYGDGAKLRAKTRYMK